MERPIIPAFPPAPELGDTVEVFDQKAFALVASLEPQRKKFNEVTQYVGEKSAEVEDNLALSEAEADRAKEEADRAKAEAEKAETEANRARDEADRSRTAANDSEQYRDETRTLIQNFDPTGVLPDGAVVDAPLVVATEQGGVRFSDRTLNEGDDPQGFFGIGENQSPRVKELLPMLHAANLYF